MFLVTEFTRAALLVLLAVFPGTALAMVVAFVTGLVRVPFMAQRSAMIPEIVGLDQVVSATKIHQVTQNLTILVGYAVGGVLVGLFTVSGALLFAAVTFAISGVLLASITHPANRTRATEGHRPESARRVDRAAEAARGDRGRDPVHDRPRGRGRDRIPGRPPGQHPARHDPGRGDRARARPWPPGC